MDIKKFEKKIKENKYMVSIRPLLHEGFSWVKRETNIPKETMKAVNLHKESNKLEQFHHENLTWVRSLDFIKQENNYLKNRLSEVVDITSDKNFLAQAEHFQNQFIIKDEFVDELKHDINEQERILMDKYIKTGIGIDDIIVQRQKNLREQMEYLEKDFTNLRNEFNNYLTQIL